MTTEAHVDVAALYAALDRRRKTLKISWRQLAHAAHVSASTLTRMNQGKRPDVDSFARLTTWLRVPADRFVRPTHAPTKEGSDLVALVSAHLRADKNLSAESQKALEEIFSLAYNSMKESG